MNTSVIVSPTRAYKALSADELRRCAPSVFAEHARPGVSARYTFVSTAQVVARMALKYFLAERKSVEFPLGDESGCRGGYRGRADGGD